MIAGHAFVQNLRRGHYELAVEGTAPHGVDALARRTYLILFWVGCLALFRSLSQIMLAISIRHAEEAAAIDLGSPR